MWFRNKLTSLAEVSLYFYLKTKRETVLKSSRNIWWFCARNGVWRPEAIRYCKYYIAVQTRHILCCNCLIEKLTVYQFLSKYRTIMESKVSITSPQKPATGISPKLSPVCILVPSSSYSKMHFSTTNDDTFFQLNFSY